MRNAELTYVDADRILQNVLKECGLKAVPLQEAERKAADYFRMYCKRAGRRHVYTKGNHLRS